MKRFVALCAFGVSVGSAVAAPVVSNPAHSITALVSSEWYTTFNGLMKDGNTLYFGNSDAVKSYNLMSGAYADYASLPSNADTKALSKAGSTMYIAIDLSYSSPYPSKLGTVDPVGGFQAQIDCDMSAGTATFSIYDSAVFGGNYYFVANPGMITNNSPLGGYTDGTKIYRYNSADPMNPVLIADVGGASGNLVFDALGNLYYASQSGEGVLKFDAADVLTGGLSITDGSTIADITASGIGFLSTGELIAETLFGQELAAYSTADGSKLYSIADTSGYEYMGKFIIGEDDTIYLISSDFSYSSDEISTIYALTVPEPGSVLLIAFGALSVFYIRRRCRN